MGLGGEMVMGRGGVRFETFGFGQSYSQFADASRIGI